MADSPRKPSDPGEPSNIGTVRSSGRRRWLQAGISAAPVIMTVASRPVLAIECRAPSGFVSGFASGAPVSQCGGGFPSYWLNATTAWPAGYNNANNASGTTFNDIFITPVLAPPNISFFQVLNLPSSPDKPLQSYIVAAYLNWAMGTMVPNDVLDEATIKAMWNQAGPPGGSYAVNGGATWNNLAVIDYLKSTMTLTT